MSKLWTIALMIALIYGSMTGKGSETGMAALEGAPAAVKLILETGALICLWSGVMEVMRRSGLTAILSRLLRPVLRRLFPRASRDQETLDALTSNVSANLLGLGNAATPMGIQAAQRMKRGGTATDELCRLIVLNTASIQLIPANVAAVRSALGCAAPFDILPAVWVTSLCSAGLGVTAAWVLGKVWRK